MVYQIRIKGHLGQQWTDWFEGMTITLEDDGNTLFSGAVADQAMLHGLLKKVRDLGMPLISVNRVKPELFYPDPVQSNYSISEIVKEEKNDDNQRSNQ